MCGIAGWLGRTEDPGGSTASFARALRHRGPDGQGIKSWGEASLVHTRLSIIDLSTTGAQPMANEDESIWTVFNGEIYNHRPLRRELEARGHQFKGRSDAEVLPHLYEEFGIDFVTKLRGMFGLAIYDVKRTRLLLARDRFGIKPLFYAPGSTRLAFASEVGALLEMPDIDHRADRQAIFDYAALFYIPAPQTLYSGIRALEPGEVLEAHLEAGEIRFGKRRFHNWSISPNVALTLTEAQTRAEELIDSAVRSQLESDVRLGALLSGGIDSSLVSAAAQAALPGKLHTFNVQFPDKNYDETWAARLVAEHISSQHQTLALESAQGTWDYVTGLLHHARQPFADTSYFAVNSVCRLMRQHVTVALSGDGGDEGFGGYNFFWQIGRIASWQNWPSGMRRAGTTLMSLLGCARPQLTRMARRMSSLHSADDTSIIQSLFCWIQEDEHSRLCCVSEPLPVRRLFERRWEYGLSKSTCRLEQLSAQATEVITRLMLPSDFLFKVDIASMKESLEIRVPMLDEDLFAFGLSLPHRLKVNGRTTKRVLRAVAKRRLPPAVAEKPKCGFAIPVDLWVTPHFRDCLRDTLLGSSSGLVEFFRPEVYGPMVEAFCEGRAYPGICRQGLYQRVIMLLSLQLALTRDCHSI